MMYGEEGRGDGICEKIKNNNGPIRIDQGFLLLVEIVVVDIRRQY